MLRQKANLIARIVYVVDLALTTLAFFSAFFLRNLIFPLLAPERFAGIVLSDSFFPGLQREEPNYGRPNVWTGSGMPRQRSPSSTKNVAFSVVCAAL